MRLPTGSSWLVHSCVLVDPILLHELSFPPLVSCVTPAAVMGSPTRSALRLPMLPIWVLASTIDRLTVSGRIQNQLKSSVSCISPASSPEHMTGISSASPFRPEQGCRRGQLKSAGQIHLPPTSPARLKLSPESHLADRRSLSRHHSRRMEIGGAGQNVGMLTAFQGLFVLFRKVFLAPRLTCREVD
jgi:hypothetical protein